MTRPVIPVSPGPDRPVTTTAESPTFAPEYLEQLLALPVTERTTHYAVLCRCHRDLWGPLCAPFQHGTVPLILDVDAAKRAVTCVYCRADMEKRGLRHWDGQMVAEDA